MAGIGFRLQALAAEGSYLKATTAYVSSAVITSGPWLSGVLALALLQGASQAFLTQAEHDLLFATIVVIFAASLVVVGGPQMVITRYLADRMYVQDVAAFAPTCAGVLLSVFPLALITLPFVAFAPFDLRYRLLAATLFITLSLTWLLMIFLSAARDYWRVLLVLGSGYLLSLTCAIVFGARFHLLGALGGFTLGQVSGLAALGICVWREFPANDGVDFAFGGYFRTFWDLGLIGMLYMLGLWVDSMLFWWSPGGVVVQGFYHLFPPYDTAKFLAYLPTIPAAAYFVIHLETHFYRHYRAYYDNIAQKGTLDQIRQAKRGMQAAIRAGLIALFKIQGAITLFVMLMASDLAHFARLSLVWVPLLRVTVGAASAQYFMLVAILLLLYLDQRRDTLIVTATFVGTNIVLTLITLRLGHAFYGYGYLGAGVISAVLGWVILHRRLTHFESLTFMSQPLIITD